MAAAPANKNAYFFLMILLPVAGFTHEETLLRNIGSGLAVAGFRGHSAQPNETRGSDERTVYARARRNMATRRLRVDQELFHGRRSRWRLRRFRDRVRARRGRCRSHAEKKARRTRSLQSGAIYHLRSRAVRLLAGIESDRRASRARQFRE